LSVPPRVMGKAAFVHLSDGVSRLQIYVRRDDVQQMTIDDGRTIDGWQLFGLLDHGDFIGVAGYLFVTKTGELSVHVRSFEFLAKALVPMPDKMHGISDPEIGRRQRYVDLIASSLKIEREPDELTTREVFARRSKLITEMRHFLDAHGYVEVETPMLTPIASGAAARPFKTYHNALDIDLYARVAPELYLKRLLVGGFEKVYELNRNFRNEGIGYRWNPEFTMLEFYCAYMDVNGMMDFCEEMLRSCVEKATGGTRVQFGNDEIDFGRPFERLIMREAIIKHWPAECSELGGERFDPSWLDDAGCTDTLALFTSNLKSPDKTLLLIAAYHLKLDNSPLTPENLTNKVSEIKSQGTISALWKFAKEMIPMNESNGEPPQVKMSRKIAEIFESVAESRLEQPTFITDFPKAISPLSKASPADLSIAERFELFIAGMEVANGFSELNDPAEQHERFLDQQAQRERGDEEAMQMDEDYLRALAYGMPPAAGIGIGIDRLTMIVTNRRSIRDVILFPHMRPAHKAEEKDVDEA
ncbi:MAG: lysine--tRNA ligase, partial [Pyrinomonadaceae bacterium]|nr:lysine--tRNA ligase [Pyrinomonadaceae bacterium]